MKNLFSYAFLIFLLLQHSGLSGQVRKGFKLMERMRYSEALAAFSENPKNKAEAVLQAFGLADLYNTPGFSAFSPQEAYKYYLLAEDRYHQLNYEQRKRLKNVSLVLLNNLRRNIEAQAFRMAEAYDNVEDWNIFLQTFTKASAKLKSSAYRQRNELLFEQAQAEGSLEAWQRLMGVYGKSLKRYNKNLFDFADRELFLRYFTLHGTEDFPAFAKQHPASAFAKSCTENCKEPLCLPDVLKCLEKSADVEGLFAFAEKYPHTSFQREAVDALAELLSRYGSEDQCVRFVEQYAGYTSAAGKVWMRLYESYKFQHPLFEDLRHFLHMYPEFPYEEQIISDYLDRQTRMYQLVLQEPSWSNCKSFVQSFPDAPHVKSVYAMLFDLWFIDHETYEDVKVFAEMFPDYPYPEDLENMRQNILQAKAKQALAEGNSTAYRTFLRKYADRPEAKPVWQALYEHTKREDASARALERFKARYPDFPYMTQLEADLAARQRGEMEAAYAEAKRIDKMYAYTAFLQRYPNNPYGPQLESRMAEIAINNRQPYFCEQYLEHFPNGAHSKEVEELLNHLASAAGEQR